MIKDPHIKYGVSYGAVLDRGCTFGQAMVAVEEGFQARRPTGRYVHVYPTRPVSALGTLHDTNAVEYGFFTYNTRDWRPTRADMKATDWEVLSND